MLENTIIFDGKKIYAFFPDGEMYVEAMAIKYQSSETIGRGMTNVKYQHMLNHNWDAKASIVVSHEEGNDSIRILFDSLPRLNSHTGGITHFSNEIILTKDGANSDTKIIYHPKEKLNKKGKLRKNHKRRWVVDPINPEVPEKFLILSHLEQHDYGFVKVNMIKVSPAQALKRLIKRHAKNFRDQCRDDLAEKLERQYIWEIYFNDQGKIQFLKYNINSQGTSFVLDEMMGLYYN